MNGNSDVCAQPAPVVRLRLDNLTNRTNVRVVSMLASQKEQTASESITWVRFSHGLSGCRPTALWDSDHHTVQETERNNGPTQVFRLRPSVFALSAMYSVS